MRYDVLSTGRVEVDGILGGGFLRGCVAEVYGDEAGGKTSLALQTIAQAKRPSIYFDLDGTFPSFIATERGITERTYVLPGRRSASDFASALSEFRPGAVDVVVFDPLAVLGAPGVIDLLPVMVSQARRLQAAMITVNHCDILYQSTGHSILSRYAAQRLEVRFVGTILNEAGAVVGMNTACRCTKSSITPSRGRCTLSTLF